jgi:hypothetical protein
MQFTTKNQVKLDNYISFRDKLVATLSALNSWVYILITNYLGKITLTILLQN